MTYEQLTSLLAATKEQIRAFDNKAQVLLEVNGVLVGFITAEVQKPADYGASGLPKRLIAICIVLGVAFPRLVRVDEPKSSFSVLAISSHLLFCWCLGGE